MTADPARWLLVTTGIVAANLLGAAFCLAFFLLFQLPDRVGLQSTAQQWFYGFAVMAIWPSLVLVPMAMGIAAAYFWRNLPSVYGNISCGGLLLRWLLPSVRTCSSKREQCVC